MTCSIRAGGNTQSATVPYAGVEVLAGGRHHQHEDSSRVTCSAFLNPSLLIPSPAASQVQALTRTTLHRMAYCRS